MTAKVKRGWGLFGKSLLEARGTTNSYEIHNKCVSCVALAHGV